MALLIRSSLPKLSPNFLTNKIYQPSVSCRCLSQEAVRGRKMVRQLKKRFKKEAREKEQKEKETTRNLIPGIKLQYEMESLASRGFLRSMKPYTPPKDVKERILNLAGVIFKTANTVELEQMKLNDSFIKYKLLVQCKKEFLHPVMNSQLHKIKNVGDVLEYYGSPVKTNTTLDDLNKPDMPPNLHVIHDYCRFHPDTDEKFGGISAFPERSTIVTGLKARKLYKGFNAGKIASKLKL